MSLEPSELPGRFAQQYARTLGVLGGTADFAEAAGLLAREAAAAAGFEAAGLRVRDDRNDYPHLASEGYERSFVEKGRALCAGAPTPCVCGLVAAGCTDPGRPFFTKGGGFWTNSVAQLASGGVPGVVPGGTCVQPGHESAGIFPLRWRGETVGLLQVGDRRAGRFDPEVVAFLEAVAAAAGPAAAAFRCGAELSRARRELEQQLRGGADMVVMSEMASSLAHDVKNPLASMMLSANRLLRLARGNERIEPLADHVCAAIKTLGDTVTRITGSFGHPRMETAPVAVNDVLEDAIFIVAPRAAGQGVRVVRDLDGSLPRAAGDAGFLKRAFLNVLTNALEAMPSGGDLRVESRLAEGRQVEVVVSDSGPGIAPEVADRLFKPFVTTKADGPGLGLSVVRRIMELHRGLALLEPGGAGGARAVLRLPLAEAGRA